MQKHLNLVDLVKSFPTNILLQNLASIQKRTSSLKFVHLAEKSENDSISNLSTKVLYASAGGIRRVASALRAHPDNMGVQIGGCCAFWVRSEVNSELNFPPNFEGLVLGCIDADFCK